MKNLHQQIDVLLEAMQEQSAQIKQHPNNIPQIELDLLLSNLRKTYEFVCELNKLNKTDNTNSLAPANPEKAETQAPKEASGKNRSSVLPFEVPFFNKFKKESPEVTNPASAQNYATTQVKLNTGLKLESTTLPPFGPYVTIPKAAPVVETPAAAIPAPEAVTPDVAASGPTEPANTETNEFIQTPEPDCILTIDQGPVFEVAGAPEPIAPTSVTPAFESLVFDMPIEARDQEVLTQTREKIFKEESKKQNPLKKIVDLFEDSLPGHEGFGESFSILDKLMKKKEDTSLVEKLRHTPIADLRTAVGVNEKFQFINELFGGNYEDYNASMELINKCKSFTDAEIFIAENIFDKYKWEVENRNVATFMDLIERRFL